MKKTPVYLSLMLSLLALGPSLAMGGVPAEEPTPAAGESASPLDDYGALGISVALNQKQLTITQVLKDTPAERAGLKPGDVISKIKGQSTNGMTVAQAVKLYCGKVGSKVKLTVTRKGSDFPMEFTLTRALIVAPMEKKPSGK
jgi:C-terminal processing protease CtpA/Prc